MNVVWALKIPPDDVGALGPLRRIEGAEVHESDESIWVRGTWLDDALEVRLRATPGAERYRVLPDGQLVASEARVPKGQLPEGQWQPLHRWLGVTLAQAEFAAEVPNRIELQLVRAATEHPISMLETTIDAWRRWATDAPQLRLKPLHFAASADGRILVRGEPLPPLPGKRYAVADGIAVPAGWTWHPAIDTATVRSILGLESSELTLLRPDGPWEVVDERDFARARRSAVRQTAGRLANE